ncbi:hypothetical protein Bbelb_092110 [Branchiostoma belcheri]|nr:hypothetical protein Bbelb_092110 [Branchiostoma belcheri]
MKPSALGSSHQTVMLRLLLFIVIIAVFAAEAHGKPSGTSVQGTKAQDVRKEPDGGLTTEPTPHQTPEQQPRSQTTAEPTAATARALPSAFSGGTVQELRRGLRGAPSIVLYQRTVRRAKSYNKKLWRKMLSMRRMANLSYLAFPISLMMEPQRG